MAASASRAPSRPSPAAGASASSVLQIAASPVPAPGGRGRGTAFRHPASQLDLRVSDAERAEVADQLSHHYGAGRLDDQEFSERLDRVMGATTYRDLGGVLQDLPGSVVPPAPGPPARPSAQRPARPRRGRGLLRLTLAVLLVILAAAVAHAVVWAIAPVLWIGVLCAIALLAARARRRR
jgi:hypothetical protein